MTWEEKRKEILKRDNFTCQSCRQFNPELGQVQLNDDATGNLEIHEYFNHPDPLKAEYHISQRRNRFTFQINFGNCWPVFPVLQVHHRKYIMGRASWNYPSNDLITYCKSCHESLHLIQPIPIFSEDNRLIDERMFHPVDVGIGRRHNCDNWTFIQQIGNGEYVLSNIYPKVSMVLFPHEDSVNAEQEARQVLDDFIRKYFPRYVVNR